MSIYTLTNDQLSVAIKTAGAELTSVKDVQNDVEYLWYGSDKYWNRQSPILFPIVGSVQNREIKWQGKTYTMGQHGFARDMEFTVEVRTDEEIWFALTSNDRTREMYPFDFKLSIGYKLEGRTLTVFWKVKNESAGVLPFSIGGHPAFMCPIDEQGSQTDYYILTDAKDKLVYGEIDMSTGLLVKSIKNYMELDETGAFPVTEHLFDNDALVVENNQIHKLSLATPDKKPYVTMRFDMPLCGIWSPTKKNAPFICLEPWCGRCDDSEFHGELDEREYGTVLEEGGEFNKSYELEFHKI